MTCSRPRSCTRPTCGWSTSVVSCGRTAVSFGVAAQMMRRILVDRARARKMASGPASGCVTVDDAAKATPPLNVDVLDLDAALARFAEFDPRRCQLAELRFWRVVLAEAGDALGISIATAERDWQAARARLSKELRPGHRGDA